MPGRVRAAEWRLIVRDVLMCACGFVYFFTGRLLVMRWIGLLGAVVFAVMLLADAWRLPRRGKAAHSLSLPAGLLPGFARRVGRSGNTSWRRRAGLTGVVSDCDAQGSAAEGVRGAAEESQGTVRSMEG
jgi:hypothetical protein